MNRPTHVFVGISAGLLICGLNPYVVVCGVLGGVGGYLPDFDLRYRHRKFLHNIFALTLFTLLIYFGLILLREQAGFTKLSPRDTENISLSFSIGYLLHLLMDSLTKMGVYILYPLSNRFRLRIPIFRSSSSWANGFGFMVGGILLYLWIEKIGVIYVLENFISFFEKLFS